MNTPTDSSTTEKPDTESPQEKQMSMRTAWSLIVLGYSATFLLLSETIRSWAKLGRMLGWW